MFGIGETELVIIVVFAFMLFGPDKLPGMGRTLGRVLRQFREASDGFTEVVQTNIMDPASEELEKSPKQRKREAAASRAEDADVSADEAAEIAAPKRETFAERKARLMAERKAAEEAASTEASLVDQTAEDEVVLPDGDVDSDDDLPAAPVLQAPQDEEANEPAAPKSAADLYALTSQGSSRLRAKESTTREGDGNAED